MIEFIERKDFIGRTPEEVSKEFQQKVDAYTEEISKLSVEELQQEEKKLIPMMNDWDNIVKDIIYDLPKEVASPNGTKVSRTTVGKYICDMLNKVECEFSYTLGYYQLFMWWSKPKAQIDYHTLNGTLHVLGSGLKFRGPSQWEAILTINEYFKSVHNEYAVDNMITYFYGLCHNAILDKLKIDAPIENHDQEAEQGPIHIDEGQPVGDPAA